MNAEYYELLEFLEWRSNTGEPATNVLISRELAKTLLEAFASPPCHAPVKLTIKDGKIPRFYRVFRMSGRVDVYEVENGYSDSYWR